MKLKIQIRPKYGVSPIDLVLKSWMNPALPCHNQVSKPSQPCSRIFQCILQDLKSKIKARRAPDGSISTSNLLRRTVVGGHSGHSITTASTVQREFGAHLANHNLSGVLVNSNISTYITGSSLIALGLSWWQAIICMFLSPRSCIQGLR